MSIKILILLGIIILSIFIIIFIIYYSKPKINENLYSHTSPASPASPASTLLSPQTHHNKTELNITQKITNSSTKTNQINNAENYLSKSPSNPKISVPIYYINLPGSSERQKFMENQFNKFKITNFKRINAVDGSQITFPMKYFKTNHNYSINGVKFWNNYSEKINNKELACSLSHLLAIKTAYDDNLEHVIILEDDASLKLVPYWPLNFQQYIDRFPPNWQCVSLFNQACYIEDDLPQFIHIRDKLCWGAVAYIINRNGMKEVLYGMDDILIMDKNDPKNFNTQTHANFLSDVFIFNRIPHCYTLKYPLFFPYNDSKEMDSTIHPDHTRDHKIISLEIANLYTHTDNLNDLK